MYMYYVCMHASMHKCVYVIVPHTIQHTCVRICFSNCEHAFKCTQSGEKVRLNKWEILTHVWAKVHIHHIHVTLCIHLL